LARGQPGGPHLGDERNRRALARSGCTAESFRLILAHLDRTTSGTEERAQRISGLSEFARAIGPAAARDYFRAIEVTGAVAELTDPAVLAFARSVDRHTAEWYFWAIWGTKSVAALTSPHVIQAVEFFERIDPFATVEFFVAIRETREAVRLTDPRVLAFAERIGSEAAVEYFGAFWETRGAPELTDDSLLSFAEGLGGEGAREYFRALRETRAVRELLDGRVRSFGERVGRRVSREFFRAVRVTKAVGALTDEDVLIFAEVIGKGPARQYFQVLQTTKAVAELTDPEVLRASGVVRSIGAEAALDYFLAIAAHRGVPPVTSTDGSAGARPTPAGTPVATLLDIPTFTGYRSLGLLGITGLFWWGAFEFAGAGPELLRTLPGLVVSLGAWAVLLGAGYLVLGAVVGRAQERFLEDRRRLLNEHGIRWHDCRASPPGCGLCWSSPHTHDDRRFDYSRFCRCPAC